MSRMRGVWRAAGSLVVVGLLVGGCTGGDPEPATTSAAPVVESPTPSPSPTRDLTRLPERPAAMDEPTSEGAVAAASYVLQLFPYTFNTGDVGPWKSMTLDTCVFCAGVVEDVEDLRAAGDVVSGGAIQVVDAEVQEINPAQWYAVTLKARQEPSERRNRDGELVTADPATTYTIQYAISWADCWRVDEMSLADAERADTGGGEK